MIRVDSTKLNEVQTAADNLGIVVWLDYIDDEPLYAYVRFNCNEDENLFKLSTNIKSQPTHKKASPQEVLAMLRNRFK